MGKFKKRTVVANFSLSSSEGHFLGVVGTVFHKLPTDYHLNKHVYNVI